jgi:hypothetical protein
LDQGFQLIGSNKKWGGVEVDLLLFKNHYHLVEVKSLRCLEEMPFRVSIKQKQRLLWVRAMLQETQQMEVQLHFAFVHNKGIFIHTVDD